MLTGIFFRVCNFPNYGNFLGYFYVTYVFLEWACQIGLNILIIIMVYLHSWSEKNMSVIYNMIRRIFYPWTWFHDHARFSRKTEKIDYLSYFHFHVRLFGMSLSSPGAAPNTAPCTRCCTQHSTLHLVLHPTASCTRCCTHLYNTAHSWIRIRNRG